MPHAKRPALAGRYPVHVTLRVRRDVAGLRRHRCFQALKEAFRKGCDRFGFRLLQFTVQSNHLHLLCEASDERALWRGLQGLQIRMAKGLNRRLERSGSVFSDRYHARILRTPREVRNCLVYVLNNSRRHDAAHRISSRDWVDGYSSAGYFDGWRFPIRGQPWAEREREAPVAEPSTWLVTKGWRRLGLLRFDEIPGGADPARDGKRPSR